MADPDVVRSQPRAEGELGFRSASARPRALVTFGSRGFRLVLKATMRQDVGCIDYRGRTSCCGGDEQLHLADHVHRCQMNRSSCTQPRTHAPALHQTIRCKIHGSENRKNRFFLRVSRPELPTADYFPKIASGMADNKYNFRVVVLKTRYQICTRSQIF